MTVSIEPVPKKGPCGDHHKSLEIQLKSVGQKKICSLIDNLVPDRSFLKKNKK